jgi:chorismate mutase/prephenate dehydratase
MNNGKEFPSLQASREAIDRIDREIVRLFCERMSVSANVAEYKRATGKPVFDAARERALLCKISELRALRWKNTHAHFMRQSFPSPAPISTSA